MDFKQERLKAINKVIENYISNVNYPFFENEFLDIMVNEYRNSNLNIETIVRHWLIKNVYVVLKCATPCKFEKEVMRYKLLLKNRIDDNNIIRDN